MRKTLLLLLLSISLFSFSQVTPDFLQGTWKMEKNELYEHWDRLNETSLRGVSYGIKDGKMGVIEYLEITQKGRTAILKAVIPGHNGGKTIAFKQTKSASSLIFENPKHDFPKEIEYRKLNDDEIFVRISGGNNAPIEYKMIRQKADSSVNHSGIANPNYDAALAEKLGGDERGMKGFILVLLKTGPSTITSSDTINALFRGHLDNINRLVAEGKMVVAGPLGKNDKTYRGIFIMNRSSIEEAKALMDTDPAIKEGLLEAELYNWYGSAALPEYLDAADKIWKVKP